MFLPAFKRPKKQSLFALQDEPDDFGAMLGPDNLLKAKGAGILRPTASNQNINGPYNAKKSMAEVIKSGKQSAIRQ